MRLGPDAPNFMHNESYADMCGPCIIALATVAVAQGLVAVSSPEARIGIDSPAGFIEAFAKWDGNKVGKVRFKTVSGVKRPFQEKAR